MLKILIPVDGSTASKYSIEKAMTTNILKDAEIHLITVISPSKWSPTRNPGLNKELEAEGSRRIDMTSKEIYDIPTLNPSLNAELLEALKDADNSHAENILKESKESMASLAIPKTQVMRQGDAAEEIIKYSDEIGANLIVMGSRGLGTFSKVLLGSVSQKVLSYSSCSILIVKEPANKMLE